MRLGADVATSCIDYDYVGLKVLGLSGIWPNTDGACVAVRPRSTNT